MQIGKMRRQVTLQTLGTRVDDGAAGGSIPFNDVATVWARIEPLAGRELFVAQQFDPSITIRVTIRYRTGIKPSDRIVYGTRVFDIKAPPVDPEEKHRELQLLCEELVTW
jgi:SPP1 family predicted phage head-tail adaptor